jgi:enoyl-CoA hydratase/carnithine racemase
MEASTPAMPVRDEVHCEVIAGVAVISLNRPERHNAVNESLRSALRDALAWAEADSRVGAVLLRGNGPSFCSGRDTTELGHRQDGDTHESYIERVQANRLRQFEMRKPVLGAIHGAAYGAGAELSLAMDFRIAGEDLRLCLPEVNYGLVVDTGASVFATELAGPSRARWLIMSGEPVDAPTALGWGLVDWIVPNAQLHEAALRKAQLLASRPAQAVRHAKRLVNEPLEARLRSGLRRELLTQCLLFEGAEYKDITQERRASRAARAKDRSR